MDLKTALERARELDRQRGTVSTNSALTQRAAAGVAAQQAAQQSDGPQSGGTPYERALARAREIDRQRGTVSGTAGAQVERNPLLSLLPEPGTRVSTPDNFSLAKNPPLAGLPVPTGTGQSGWSGLQVQTPELKNAFSSFRSKTGRQFSGGGRDLPDETRKEALARTEKARDEAKAALREAEKAANEAIRTGGDTEAAYAAVNAAKERYDAAKQDAAQYRNSFLNVLASALGGALGSAKGFANAAGYGIQTGIEQQMRNEANKSEALGNLFEAFGSDAYKGIAGVEQKASQEQEDRELQTAVHWGDDFNQRLAERTQNIGRTGRIINDVARGVGGMAPSIAANAVVPGTSLPVLFTYAAGNATEEALNDGADKNAAILYGTAVGAVEVLTEKMFGGIPGMGSGGLDETVESAIKSAVRHPGAQFAISALVDAMGEGFEEFVSEFADKALNDALVGSDVRTWDETAQDALYSALIGGLTGAVMNIGPSALRGMSETQAANAIGEQMRPALDELISIARSQGGNAAKNANAVSSRQTAGENVKNWEVGQLYSSVADGLSAENTAALARAANKNAAPVEAAGNVGLVPLSEHDAANLSTGKNNIIANTVQDILSFIRSAKEKKGGSERLYMGTMTDTAARFVRDQTGVDVSGYVAILPGSSVQHIFKNHGNEQTESSRGQRAVTENDIALIPQVLTSPDSVELSGDKDKLGRAVLLFTKQIGDTYITAQAVTDGRHAIATNSLWIQKKSNPLVTTSDSSVAAAPGLDVQNAPPSGYSTNIVAQTGAGVNTGETTSGVQRKPGLVQDAVYQRAHLSSTTRDALDALGRALGVEVRMAEDLGDVNATYENGVITLSLRAGDPVMTSAIHEAVHRVREAAPEAYDTLESFVRRAMSEGQLEYNVKLREALYGTENADYLTEEVVADAFGRMLNERSILDRFTREHRSAAQKLRDALRDIVNAVKRLLNGQNRRLTQSQRESFSDLENRLSAMEALFGDALEKAGNSTESSGEARNSISATLGNELDQVLNGTFRSRNNEVYIGDTSKFLTDVIGIDALDVTMPPNKAYSAMVTEEQARRDGRYQERTNYHGLGKDGLIDALNASETPIAAFADTPGSSGKRANHIVLITDKMVSGKNIAVIEALETKSYRSGKRIEANKVITSFDRAALANDVIQAAADGRLLFVDKKRSQDFLAGVSAANSRRAIQEADFTTNIRNFLQNVKWENSGNRIYTSENAESGAMPEWKQRLQDYSSRESRSDRELLDEYIKKYGPIPKGERASRDVELPRQTGESEKVSRTVRTVMEAKATPDEALPSIEKLAAAGKFSYEVYSDKQAISDAAAQIEEVGWTSALEKWTKAVKSGNVSKANTAMGWALYNNAVNKGDTDLAIDVLEKMVEHQRSAAQAVQATRILKQMTPETQLYGVQRSVANLQAELNERYGDKKAPELKLDPDLAERVLNAETQEARDAALRDIYRDIGRQMPSRFRDRWNAWRYLAMLGNARTHGRNFVGNLGFALPVAIKDAAATGIEAAVYRLSGGRMERSKAFGKDFGKLAKAAWSDYAKVQETALGGGKYSDMQNANKYVEEGRKIFGNLPTNSRYAAVRTAARTWNNTVGKALESFRKFNGKALDAEDVLFSKPHYAFAMAQFCKANGITAEQIRNGERLEAARDYAILEAQKATYRDTNEFSQMVSQLGRSGTGSKNRFVRGASTVMEGILPFRKTPANILARGVEYSPIGLLNGIYKATAGVAKGKYTAAQAIDSISAGLTGSGLMAFGMFLAAQGLVRGRGGDDDEKRKFEEMQGHQAYSLELPDGTSVTLDWLAPEALPFFVGVNLWEATHEKKAGEDGKSALTLSEMLNAVSNVSEPMLEMSCLQSLNDVFDAVGYAADEDVSALVSALASAATSYVTQALPTLLGQAERTGESKRYTTYTEKNSFLTGDMQYALGKASARTPGWDFQQIPYIDAWGREENSGELPERAFNNFLNPSYTSKIETSEMEKELLRLYEETGEATVLPDRAPKYLSVLGERVYLSAEDYVQIARARGELSYELVNDLVASDEYKKMGDPDKADAVKGAYNAAKLEAVRQVFGAEYAMKTCGVQAYEKAQKAVENGSTWEAYYSIYTGNRGVVEDWRKYLNAAMQPFGETARLGALAAMMPETTYEKLEAAVADGISVYNYVSFRYDIKDLEGDKDKDGNVIPGSKKEKIVEVIDGLNLTSEQKDFLYLQQRYSEDGLRDTPWHKRK